MSMSVKLFVKQSGSDEVQLRRFSVDQDVSTSYEYLSAKIRATLPSAGDAAIKLFWKDEEGDMISFSGDEELVEALGYVNDGVFHVYVELDPRNHSTTTQPDPHHGIIGALSSLLAGSTPHGACFHACGGSCEPGLGRDSGNGHRSDQGTEHAEKDENEHEKCPQKDGQDLRQLIVDTANAFLEPHGLKVVSCDEGPSAAGASMTSSHDPETEVGATSATNCRDHHAAATGRLTELMSALGFDAEVVGSWLTHLMMTNPGSYATHAPAGSATG